MSPNLLALIATAAAFLVMLLVTLVLLREPIASLMDTWHEDAKVRALNNAVTGDRDEAARKLTALRQVAQEFSRRVERAIGVSLERITEAPSDTPSEITEAIRKDDAFNDAWEEIRRAYPVPADFASWQAALADVEARLKTKAARDSDRDSLQSLGETFDQRIKALTALEDRVEVLGKILALRRTEKRFSNPERNSRP